LTSKIDINCEKVVPRRGFSQVGGGTGDTNSGPILGHDPSCTRHSLLLWSGCYSFCAHSEEIAAVGSVSTVQPTQGIIRAIVSIKLLWMNKCMRIWYHRTPRAHSQRTFLRMVQFIIVEIMASGRIVMIDQERLTEAHRVHAQDSHQLWRKHLSRPISRQGLNDWLLIFPLWPVFRFL